VGFRDDNEALRARVRALEEENDELKSALEQRSEAPAEVAPVPAPPVEIAPTGDLSDMVRRRERAEHVEKQREAAATAQQRAR
jgi:hypothetical protein